MTNEYYGYLYETIIPMSDGEKHYYGKKEYDHKLYKGYVKIYNWYWGSGVIIKAWFKKHTNGKYNSRCCPEEIATRLGVKRIIHGFYKTRKELCEAEKNLVALHLGKDYCINMSEGGHFGGYSNQELKNTMLTKINFEHKNDTNLNHKKGHPAWNKGMKYTKEQCNRIKELRKDIDMSGINNPVYGKHFWNNGKEQKFQKECPGENWVRGMLPVKATDKRHFVKNKESNRLNLIKALEKHRKRVMCIELNMTFDSLKDAQEFFKSKSGNISQCCKGKRKTAHGYHWKFIETDKNKD